LHRRIPPVITTGPKTTKRNARHRAMETPSTDWCQRLPVLHAVGVALRELVPSDAESLFQLLSPDEVSRFISPPPTTVDGYTRFIEWAVVERAEGRLFCFGVVPDGHEHAVGLIQVRRLTDRSDAVEWGFAVGLAFWGNGVFETAARMVLGFVFETMGVERVEARACVANGRGNGALIKCGGVCEAVLRESFAKHGDRLDQNLWSIMRDHWRATVPQPPHIH
jgi:RimJ/RimL family protein N-acetyltransferase